MFDVLTMAALADELSTSIVGGQATILGPIIGAVGLTLVSEQVWSRDPNLYQVIFVGIIILVLAVFFEFVIGFGGHGITLGGFGWPVVLIVVGAVLLVGRYVLDRLER